MLKRLGIIPEPRMFLMCDFHGYVVPEITKTRHVVVVSPKTFNEWGTTLVVPISSRPPDHNSRVYVELEADSYGCLTPGQMHWAKCHLAAHVRIDRLDRVLDGGRWRTPLISPGDMALIRRGIFVATGM